MAIIIEKSIATTAPSTSHTPLKHAEHTCKVPCTERKSDCITNTYGTNNITSSYSKIHNHEACCDVPIRSRFH
ncbi:hypothetical protein BASA83_004666 [Batrachochytrium salamandrivorans]|nr:hypothetical protein BASA83_004666 [Batrachochytrium salamandrivorans]